MLRYIKIVIAAVLTILSLFGLCSCGTPNDDINNTEQPLTVFANGESEYTVICPYLSEAEVVNAALMITNTAEKKTGAVTELAVDRNVEYTPGAFEILVGETNRNLPEALIPNGPSDYVIAVHENSIVILGGTDSTTLTAAQYFCDNIIADPTVLERDFIYRYTHQYTSVSINSVPVTGFALTEYDGVDSSLVAIALTQATGLACNDEQSNVSITFELDRTLESNTVRFSERDGALIISASSQVALTKIDDVILSEFANYESLNLSAESYFDFTYPIVSILDLPDELEGYFVCTSDKSPLDYALNEEMIFTLTLKCDGETVSAPGFYYTIDADGGREQIYDHVSGDCGSFEIRTSLDLPGFVKIYAAAVSEKNAEISKVPSFEGGAGAAISEIAQGVAEPEDFDEFWQSELAKLDEVKPTMTVINDLSEDYPGYTVLDIRIDCVDAPVSGYLSIPKDAAQGSLGILVGFTGYGVVSPQPTVREDRIVFAVNAHSIDNGRERGYYSEIASTVLYSYGFNNTENSSRDTVYFKNMILRDVQAIRYLKTLEEWDGKTITLNGGSQGAYQSIAVAALDSDVTYVFAAYPWLCDLGGGYANRISGWRPDYTDALRYYDAINFAKRIKCETRIDAGIGDYVSPPSGVIAMINAMSAPVTLNATQGMTHYYTPPEAETFTQTK